MEKKPYRTVGIVATIIVAIILALIIIPASFTRITDADVGIRQTFSGEIEDTVLGQGLHQTVVGDVIKVSKRNLVLNVESQPIVVEKIPMQEFQLKVNYGIVPSNAAIAYKTEKAQHIITVSNYSKDDLVKTYAVKAEKITVAWNAASNIFKPIELEQKQLIRNTYSNGKQYFVFDIVIRACQIG